MNKTTIVALLGALSLAACSERADWVESDVTPTVEVEVEVAKPAPAPKPQPIKPQPEPEPAPEVDINADLYVKRLVIAHGVEGREPVEPATAFEKAERIYAFVEVGNRDESASEVYVSFVRDGARDNGGVRLRVGASPRWRTWAYTMLAKDAGTWHAVVKNAKGEELARTAFEVIGSEPAPLKSPA